jgi:hypothetical protein
MAPVLQAFPNGISCGHLAMPYRVALRETGAARVTQVVAAQAEIGSKVRMPLMIF